MQLEGTEVGQPRQRRRRVRHDVLLGLAGIGPRIAPPPDPVRGVRRHGLVPEALALDAVRVAVHVHRPAGEVGQHRRRHRRVVPDQVALGQWRLATAPGEEDLVQVGQPQLDPAELPRPAPAELVEGRQLVLGRTRPVGRAGPARRRRVTHLVVGAAGLHRPRMLLRVPALDGVVVVLLDQQPLVPPAIPPHEGEPAAQLLAEEGEVQVARRDRLDRVVPLGQRPATPVPHDDVAAAVLAGGDDALEVEVVERVVLDVGGEPLDVGVERRTLRAPPSSPARRRPPASRRSATGGPGDAGPRSATRRRRAGRSRPART